MIKSIYKGQNALVTTVVSSTPNFKDNIMSNFLWLFTAHKLWTVMEMPFNVLSID